MGILCVYILFLSYMTTPQGDQRDKLSQEQMEKLQAPLPASALKQHPTKKFLTSINPAYVIERLNEVFGTGTWKQETRVIENTSSMVVVQSTLSVPAYGISIETFGGNDNADKGDAYKGAQTDALTKAASMLGIGLHVWKNEKPVQNLATAIAREQTGSPSNLVQTHTTDSPALEIEKACMKCGVVMKYVPDGVSAKTGRAYKAFYSCGDCKITLPA
jgi:hypothetical protein